MTYRKSVTRPRCALCGETAAASCLRCARPLCAEHAPAEDSLCEPCEEEYRALDERGTRGGLLGLLLTGAAAFSLLVWLGGAALAGTWLARWSPLLWLAAAFGVSTAVMLAHRWSLPALAKWRRRRFIVDARPGRYLRQNTDPQQSS
jgi:hypothetical protein